jgi:hypothetical protein
MVTFFFVLQMLILLLEDENLSSITERLWNRVDKVLNSYAPNTQLITHSDLSNYYIRMHIKILRHVYIFFKTGLNHTF